MQRASSFRELCVFPSLRAATDMADPDGSAAVEHFSRPAAPVRISTTPAIPRTPAGDPGSAHALRPAPNCPRQVSREITRAGRRIARWCWLPKPKGLIRREIHPAEASESSAAKES